MTTERKTEFPQGGAESQLSRFSSRKLKQKRA